MVNWFYWFLILSSELSNSNLLTFCAENNSFIWSKFGDLIGSTELVKSKSMKVLAVKDLEVSAVLWQYDLTSVFLKVQAEQKSWDKWNL